MIAVQLAKNKDYDLIILDLDMPILNGYEACLRIKGKSDYAIKDIFKLSLSKNDISDILRSKCVVIALSALINNDIIQKCVEVGFDDFSKSLSL